MAARGSVDGAGDDAVESAPVAVLLEAVIGMPLSRHHEEELARAGAWIAAQRASHAVMLVNVNVNVNVIAELEDRGVQAPGGWSRTDRLRSLDPGLTGAAAKALATVGAAMSDPVWASLRVLVSTQQVSVTHAAYLIGFHQRLAPVADPDELADAMAS